MKIIIPIKLALRSLRSNIGRTIFSLLGIVIGVASVILILSLGEGLKSFVVAQVETFGTDIIEIEIKVPKTSQMSAQNISGMVGGTQITTLKLSDAEAVSKLENIGSWYGGILSQQIINYKDKNKQSFIFGVTAKMLEADDGAKIASGKMFSQNDDDGLKQVALLGSKAKERFFPNKNAVGENIKIKGTKYHIIGVMEKRGVAGAFDFDDIVFIPVQTLQKKIMGINHIGFIILKVRDMRLVEKTIVDVENIMRRRHNIEYNKPVDALVGANDDFAVISIAEAKKILDKVFAVLELLLLALASISLVVGGVGIMNVMYVTVSERTREIGLRKSVGAENNDILAQFVIESVILTLLGGMIGALIGYLLSQLATIVISKAAFVVQSEVTGSAIFIGFGFSALIGILFGFYPARSASRITPMDALRKE